MESYRGLAILATNMKSGLDRAFLRRLRFTIEFPFPGAAERKLIWQKAFPAGLATGTLDFDRPARLNLTGGSIHAIALNAARVECRKLDRPVNEADFRWLQPARSQGQGAGAA